MKKSKYFNKKVFVRNECFQSKKEANRWLELKLLEKAGQIKDLKRQVKFVLIPAQREQGTIGKRGGIKQGKLIERELGYIADFVYTENGKMVVEDAKGMRTKDYIIKRKLMLYINKIQVREI